MYKPRDQIYSAAYVFLLKDEKIFLLRRHNVDWRNGDYNLPSGHIEKGETPRVAAVREAKEEAGVDIKSEDLEIAHVMYRYSDDSDRVYIDLFFKVNKWQGDPHLAEPEAADQCDWFSLDNLPPNLIPYLKVALDNYKNRLFFSEFGWEKHAETTYTKF